MQALSIFLTEAIKCPVGALVASAILIVVLVGSALAINWYETRKPENGGNPKK